MLALFLKCSNAKATSGSVDKGSSVQPARCLQTDPFCSVLDPANALPGRFGVTQGAVCKCAVERLGCSQDTACCAAGSEKKSESVIVIMWARTLSVTTCSTQRQ